MLQLGALRLCNSEQLCNVQRCHAAKLQFVLLRRCNSRCRDVAGCNAAALQLSTTMQRTALRCCTCCCSAARVAAALRCYTGCYDAAVAHGVTSCGAVARIAATLRRGSRLRCYKLRRYRSSRCCDAAPLRRCGAATTRGAATLQCCSNLRCCDAAALQRCGAAATRGAETLRRCNSSRCCDAATLQLLWLLLFFSFSF